MKQTEDNDKGSGAPRYDPPATGGPQDEDPLMAGSPRNLVPIAMAVLLLFFAGMVFYLAAMFADSGAPRDNWAIAQVILIYLSQAVFYSGVLIGLGTLATTRKGDPASAAPRVARLLSWAGAAVVVLGVAESICIVGIEQWGGWRLEASQVGLRMGTAVFEGGVLAGLALLCLRRARGS